MSASKAAKTWFVEQKDSTLVVSGPDYVGDVENKRGETASHRGSGGSPLSLAPGSRSLTQNLRICVGEQVYPSLRIVEADARRILTGPDRSENDEAEKAFAPPVLGEWETRRADAEAGADYFAGKWKFSLTPAPMGADGDTSAYAWYRANVRVEKAGNYTLGFSDVGDWMALFVNGERVGTSKVQQRFDHPVARNFTVALKAGENTLAALTAHTGRHKLFNYLLPLTSIDAKGLSGPVSLSKEASKTLAVQQWKWRSASAAEAKSEKAPGHVDAAAGDWQDAKIGEDVFQRKKGFVWYHTLLDAVPGPHRRLYFEGVDDNATIFLNGRKLATHKGYGIPFDVKLDSAWHDSGPNELLVLVENTDGPGGIDREVNLVSNPAEDGTPVQGWRMRGGLMDPTGGRGWQPAKSDKAPGIPSLYRSEFTVTPPAASGPNPVLRFVMRGLSRGFVWLNGHNLGRYPEKTPAPGIYLPECWLKNGKNTLVIFDEEGNSPAQARLSVESRNQPLRVYDGKRAVSAQ